MLRLSFVYTDTFLLATFYSGTSVNFGNSSGNNFGNTSVNFGNTSGNNFGNTSVNFDNTSGNYFGNTSGNNFGNTSGNNFGNTSVNFGNTSVNFSAAQKGGTVNGRILRVATYVPKSWHASFPEKLTCQLFHSGNASM